MLCSPMHCGSSRSIAFFLRVIFSLKVAPLRLFGSRQNLRSLIETGGVVVVGVDFLFDILRPELSLKLRVVALLGFCELSDEWLLEFVEGGY